MHYDAVQVILQIFGSYSALVVDKEDCCISGSELDDMRTARVDAIIEDKFRDFPLHSIALSSAIRTQLTDDELYALLERYAAAINDEIKARQEEKLPGITQIRAGEKQ